MADKESFVALRKSLISEGYDLLEYEGSEDVIAVCLEPEKAIMLAELTADQALQLQEEGLTLFDGVAILNTLMQKHPDELAIYAEKHRRVEHDGPSM